MTRTVLDECPVCGSALDAERWEADESAVRRSDEEGLSIWSVRDAPDWAALFVLQGAVRVTRYTCTQCGHVAAILADEG